jgi:hypothetical protein
MPPKNQTQRIDALLSSVTEELLLGNPQQFQENGLRLACSRWLRGRLSQA